MGLTALVLTGCGHISPNRIAERKITEALPGMIGPAARYDVTVDGDAGAITRGRAKRVRVEGTDVQLSKNLTMSHLSIDAQDLAFDMHTHALDKTGPIAMVGTISQNNIDAYLAKTRPDIAVTLRESDLQADVPVSVAGLGATAHVIGTFEPSASDRSKIDFVVTSAKLEVIPIPLSIVNAKLQRVNPIFDLSNLKFPITVQRAEIKQGNIIVYGSATLGKRV